MSDEIGLAVYYSKRDNKVRELIRIKVMCGWFKTYYELLKKMSMLVGSKLGFLLHGLLLRDIFRVEKKQLGIWTMTQTT